MTDTPALDPIAMCRVGCRGLSPQFTRKDAEIPAGSCTDGTGKRGVAMFINDAIDQHQKQQQDAIDYLSGCIQ